MSLFGNKKVFPPVEAEKEYQRGVENGFTLGIAKAFQDSKETFCVCCKCAGKIQWIAVNALVPCGEKSVACSDIMHYADKFNVVIFKGRDEVLGNSQQNDELALRWVMPKWFYDMPPVKERLKRIGFKVCKLAEPNYGLE